MMQLHLLLDEIVNVSVIIPNRWECCGNPSICSETFIAAETFANLSMNSIKSVEHPPFLVNLIPKLEKYLPILGWLSPNFTMTHPTPRMFT